MWTTLRVSIPLRYADNGQSQPSVSNMELVSIPLRYADNDVPYSAGRKATTLFQFLLGTLITAF